MARPQGRHFTDWCRGASGCGRRLAARIRIPLTRISVALIARTRRIDDKAAWRVLCHVLRRRSRTADLSNERAAVRLPGYLIIWRPCLSERLALVRTRTALCVDVRRTSNVRPGHDTGRVLWVASEPGCGGSSRTRPWSRCERDPRVGRDGDIPD